MYMLLVFFLSIDTPRKNQLILDKAIVLFEKRLFCSNQQVPTCSPKDGRARICRIEGCFTQLIYYDQESYASAQVETKVLVLRADEPWKHSLVNTFSQLSYIAEFLSHRIKACTPTHIHRHYIQNKLTNTLTQHTK